MQPRDGARPKETPLYHIALPMYVAYLTALSAGPAPRQDLVDSIRGNLAQDKRPGPTDGGMP